MGFSVIYSNVNISHVERLPEAAAGHFPTTPMAHCPEISIAGFDEIGPTENVNLEEDVASWMATGNPKMMCFPCLPWLIQCHESEVANKMLVIHI